MVKIIFNIALIGFLLYKCAKNREEKHKPARMLSYTAAGTVAFAMLGQRFFYKTTLYMVGLFGGGFSFFLVAAYFLWKGREDPEKRFVFYFIVVLLICIVLLGIEFNYGVFGIFKTKVNGGL